MTPAGETPQPRKEREEASSSECATLEESNILEENLHAPAKKELRSSP
jgi:hypothetical protein